MQNTAKNNSEYLYAGKKIKKTLDGTLLFHTLTAGALEE